MLDLSHVVFCGVQPGVRLAPRRTRSSASPNESPDRLPPDPLAAWILSQAGLNPAAYRSEFAARRAAACLRRLRVPSAAAARRLITSRPELLSDALDLVLIGISGFFRDRAVFDGLRHDVLPDLLARHGTLRVLGAGVSSGMEMYSMAMLLDELGALDRTELLGLDCRARALADARAGSYEGRDLAELTADQRDQYFSPEGDRFIAIPRLRQAIAWRCVDLLQFTGDGPRQLILFRNVAIYLRPEAAAPIWSTLCDQLDHGGVLVTGKGERPPRALPLTRFGPSLYRRY